ncbi:hypothetical protein C0Q70_12522 [Pomacea canaliculata]|uniref:Uncharacterized protein n=1 Tax=Pomacea canaliculata TaxID=400727 RepID=A0A2T7P1R2_POMCA|nr:hypothetical protein C0Q70_12522 [Pomacea canaliculata]
MTCSNTEQVQNRVRVIDCVILEDLDCNGERGFKCEELSSDYAEFTVPENFSEGSFRCQTPGLAASQITSCQWPPADYIYLLILTNCLNTRIHVGLRQKAQTQQQRKEDGECPRNNTISSVEGNNTLDASLSNESEQNTIRIITCYCHLIQSNGSPVHNIHRSSAQTHEVDCTVADTKTGSREGLFQRNQQSNGSPVDFKNIDRPSAEAHEVDSTIADMKTGSRYKDSETQQNISSEEVKDLKLPLLTNVSTDHYECDGVKTRAQKSNRPRNNSPVDFNNKDQSSDETPDVDYAAEKQSIKFRNKPIPLDLLRESGYSRALLHIKSEIVQPLALALSDVNDLNYSTRPEQPALHIDKRHTRVVPMCDARNAIIRDTALQMDTRTLRKKLFNGTNYWCCAWKSSIHHFHHGSGLCDMEIPQVLKFLKRAALEVLFHAGMRRTQDYKQYRRTMGAWRLRIISSKKAAAERVGYHRGDNGDIEGNKNSPIRFCGPATTVTVPCTCPPRVSVKTLGQVVWWTGQCYTAVITLFPEQLHLLHTAPPRLFVAGPPGTGKTVVLLLMAIQWLRCGHHVYVVSTCWGSRAASIMLYHLLLQTVKTQQSAGVSIGQPHLLLYDNCEDKEKAINDLSQAARGGSLYVIADEVSGNI